MADAWKSTCERNLRECFRCVQFSCVMSQFASMDEDFNWFAVHVFDDTVGHSWQTCVIVVGVCPVFCFASLFSLDSETKIWPGDLHFGGPLQVSSDKLENLMEAALDELGKISQHGSYPAGHPLL